MNVQDRNHVLQTNRPIGTRELGSSSQCTALCGRGPDSFGLSNDLQAIGGDLGNFPWDSPRQPQSDKCGQHVAQISSERPAAVCVVTIQIEL